MRLVKENSIILSEKEYKIISKNIEKNFGIYFDESKKKDLNRILSDAFENSDFTEQEKFISLLKREEYDREFIDWFTPYITIGETYFFREMLSLDVLMEKLLPEMLEKNKKDIRIWSAACSSGEEPYTLAILIKERFPESFERIEIIGTDINPNFLNKARTGVYTAWSFRNTSPEIKEKYFINYGKNYKIVDEIKFKVKFFQMNLVADEHQGIFAQNEVFDIILLRNVLIYFSNSGTRKVLSKLSALLNEGGYLIPGLAETLLIEGEHLEPLFINQVRFFKKNTGYQLKPKTDPITQIKKDESQQKKYIESIKDRKRIRTKKDEKRVIKEPATNIGTREKSYPDYNTLVKLFEKGEYDLFIFKLDELRDSKGYLKLSNDEKGKLDLLYCKAFANKGEIEKALQICESKLNKDKLNAELHELAAQLLSEFGNYDKALKHLDAAIFLKPEVPFLHFLRANLYSKIKSYSKAQKELQLVINLLNDRNPGEIINEADGLTSGGLVKIAESLLNNMN